MPLGVSLTGSRCTRRDRGTPASPRVRRKRRIGSRSATLADRAQRPVRALVARMRSGGQQHDVPCASGKCVDGVVAQGCDRRLMRFVDDQHIPRLRVRPAKHFGLLEEVDRRDRDWLDGPRVDVERQGIGQRRERCRIDHRRADVESTEQLVSPLVAQACRRHDERAVAPAALKQFCQHQAGLNRLAEPDFVGQQKSRCMSANERERRFELKRKDVDRGALRRSQLAEARAALTACAWR